MRIGTMFLGRVDALEHESIQTKFFVLGVPLAPVSSYYVLGEHMNGIDGIELPMVHGKSALFGYVRIFSALGALLSGIFGYIERGDAMGYWALAGICVALWGLSMFLLGGIAPAEKERRLTLRRWAGIGAPPDLLDEARRDAIRLTLEKAWQAVVDSGEFPDAGDWRAILQRPELAPRGTEGLVYSLARYDGEEQRAEALWQATHGSSAR